MFLLLRVQQALWKIQHCKCCLCLMKLSPAKTAASRAESPQAKSLWQCGPQWSSTINTRSATWATGNTMFASNSADSCISSARPPPTFLWSWSDIARSMALCSVPRLARTCSGGSGREGQQVAEAPIQLTYLH
jgi:hypothetical protein